MTHPADMLLDRLRRRGVRLSAEGGMLHIHPSREHPLTLFEREAITENWNPLLALVGAEGESRGIVTAGLDLDTKTESIMSEGKVATCDYTNKGILFKNDKKPQGSKQPDYRGRLNVSGQDYELAGWIREGRNGKFMSLSVKPAGERRDGAEKQPDGARF